MQGPLAAPGQLSGDGRWYWDGNQWLSTTSPDGKQRWTGTQWVPVRKMFMGDHANQAIFCAVAGLLCGLLWPFGLWASITAYKELPHKRTQAVVGIVLNAIGCGLLVIGIVARIALSSSGTT